MGLSNFIPRRHCRRQEASENKDMANRPAILAVDQGTTSSRAIVFDTAGGIAAAAAQEFPQLYPQAGWVEQRPDDIYRSTVAVCREALARAEKAGAEVLSMGITNQRETTLVWDRQTGQPVYNAIVWQDRRTAEHCAQLRAQGHEADITARTGLLLDPYFSATKLAWILDHVEGARRQAEMGRLAFGTVDSYLLWRLSNGRIHATDATNAARTLLFNIHTQQWDEELLTLFQVPPKMLPEVRDCAAEFGRTEPTHFGRALPVQGVAGDQHAAMVGQGCFSPGMVKSTYGTGCFALLNTGARPVASRNRLLTTLAYRLGGEPTYALEGSIFIAGAAIKWLRDSLGLLRNAAESEEYARRLESNKGVYLVPAFSGLGAPHWDPHARGALSGITHDTGPAEIARAALEAVCYQTHDLMVAMASDAGEPPQRLRVDGGMAANAWLLQRLADLVDLTVERPHVIETTALGAAYLAGLQAGIWPSLEDIRHHWRPAALYQPSISVSERERCLLGWAQALRQVLTAGHNDPSRSQDTRH
ncbi:probable carbohydrate kinase [Nitrococcus mobilis Nb-231]|uniref:Glycerol kinase n=2 Tax=Nitrococcus mobilis TaxID=35797 RepID=A4BL45_9GAMM|nr:probable carbohydrate kinase [Nitrococcus mobilis Nb-231]